MPRQGVWVQGERCPRCRGALYREQDRSPLGRGQTVIACISCGWEQPVVQALGDPEPVEEPQTPEWWMPYAKERQRRVEAAVLYRVGTVVATIAVTLGVSERTVWRAVEQLGATRRDERRPRRRDDAQGMA